MADLIRSPLWVNFGFLLWDIDAPLLPFLPGSYVVKGGKVIFKFASRLGISANQMLSIPLDKGLH